MGSVTTQPQRRTLHFSSLQEILDEAERLAASPHQLLGSWSYGEILDHLARGMDDFYVGFGFQAPWFARTLIAPLIRKRVLKQPMPTGIKLPKTATALLPQQGISVADGLEHLRSATERLVREDPTHPHPFLGRLKPDEVRQLVLRHAELHLSYVVPE